MLRNQFLCYQSGAFSALLDSLRNDCHLVVTTVRVSCQPVRHKTSAHVSFSNTRFGQDKSEHFLPLFPMNVLRVSTLLPPFRMIVFSRRRVLPEPLLQHQSIGGRTPCFCFGIRSRRPPSLPRSPPVCVATQAGKRTRKRGDTTQFAQPGKNMFQEEQTEAPPTATS